MMINILSNGRKDIMSSELTNTLALWIAEMVRVVGMREPAPQPVEEMENLPK